MPDRDRGQVDLTRLTAELAGQPSFVRACLIQSDDIWTMQRLDAVVGTQLPRERAALWRYEHIVFVAERVEGDVFRAWFHADGTGRFRVSGCSATVPQVFPQANFHREPSLSRNSTPRLAWPHVVYDISAPMNPSTTTMVTGHLVGEDCPSFPSFEQTAQAFFTGVVSLAHNPGSTANTLARGSVDVQPAGTWRRRPEGSAVGT